MGVIVMVAVYAVFEAKGLSEGDQEMAAVYSEVAVINEVGVLPVAGTVTPTMAAVFTVVAVAGKSAPEMVPEFARLVAPVEPAIVNWLAVTPVMVYPAVAERVTVAVYAVFERKVEATEGDQLTAPV